ncbi:MAG: hypothetical protein C0594_07005 [Marinilabiliales bacterium]|nr:MAG: hypothetical protein C0594_07005 [Marinilabiliales bacterium]
MQKIFILAAFITNAAFSYAQSNSYGFHLSYPFTVGENYFAEGSAFSFFDQGYKGFLKAGLTYNRFTKNGLTYGICTDIGLYRNNSLNRNAFITNALLLEGYKFKLQDDLEIFVFLAIGYSYRFYSYFLSPAYTYVPLPKSNSFIGRGGLEMLMKTSEKTTLSFCLNYDYIWLEYSMMYSDDVYFRSSQIFSSGIVFRFYTGGK